MFILYFFLVTIALILRLTEKIDNLIFSIIIAILMLIITTLSGGI